MAIFQTIRQESARHKVYVAIREAILSGRLRTGQRITELQLTRELNISRAIIREALQQLAHEGLVEQNAYKGTRVVCLSPDQVDELFSLRTLLEGEAIRQAKVHLQEGDREVLQAMLSRLEDATTDGDLYAKLDLALHSKIWELSRNRTLEKLLMQVTAPLFAMGGIVRRASLPGIQRAHADHTVVVAALCEGTADEAAEAIRAHIAQNREQVRTNFKLFVESERDAAP